MAKKDNSKSIDRSKGWIKRETSWTEREPAAGVFFKAGSRFSNFDGKVSLGTSTRRQAYGRYADSARHELLNSAEERAFKAIRKEK